jgi:hypothetical protein
MPKGLCTSCTLIALDSYLHPRLRLAITQLPLAKQALPGMCRRVVESRLWSPVKPPPGRRQGQRGALQPRGRAPHHARRQRRRAAEPPSRRALPPAEQLPPAHSEGAPEREGREATDGADAKDFPEVKEAAGIVHDGLVCACVVVVVGGRGAGSGGRGLQSGGGEQGRG